VAIEERLGFLVPNRTEERQVVEPTETSGNVGTELQGKLFEDTQQCLVDLREVCTDHGRGVIHVGAGDDENLWVMIGELTSVERTEEA
jgi:hypothetical protein